MNGKRVMKTKKPVALVAILVLLCCAVAGTVAYLVTSTGPVTNTFTPASVTTEVEETFDGTTKSNVRIKNTGNIDAYIRAAVIVNWVNDAGEIYGTAPVASTEDAPGDYTISYDETYWFKGSDGYWYYTKPVAPSTENNPQYTGVLIESCAPAGQAPAGYALQVTILADGIQSEPVKAVSEAWPAVRVGTNGLGKAD